MSYRLGSGLDIDGSFFVVKKRPINIEVCFVVKKRTIQIEIFFC